MKRLLVLLMVVMPIFVSAQKKQGRALLDSLLQEVPGSKEDTNKAQLLNSIAEIYWSFDPDQGISFGQQALALSKKLGWKKGIAGAYVGIGVNYQYKSDYQKSLDCYQRALQIDEEIDNRFGIGVVYGNMCIVYIDQGDYSRALDCGFKSLKIDEGLKNARGISSNLTNIGIIYDDQGDYAQAIEYHTKALNINEEGNDRNSIAISLSNIGLIYLEEKNYPKALENLDKAQEICKELGNKIVYTRILNFLGEVYSGMHDYSKALEYLFLGLKIDEEFGTKAAVAEKLTSIGIIYLTVAGDTTGTIKEDRSFSHSKPANLKKAIEYLSRAAEIHKQIGSIKDLSENYQGLSTAWELLGNDKAALQYHKLFMFNKDSVFSEQNKVKLSKLETKREIELKDKQILIGKLEIAKRRNEAIFYIVGIVLLLLVIVFIYRNYSSQKRSNIIISKEKKRSEDLLLNILPLEVANELKDKGSAEAKNYDNVTVMFSDFVNFTGAGEKMTPQELINELHVCFKAFDTIIDKYNIEKIKTIGDAYLLVSGLPVPDEDHAAHVVSAAIEINKFMQERIAQLGDKTFEVRIGIHSGSVVAGIVGVKKFAYDIWGDTVNTAARMEQNSQPGKINISQTTYELVKGMFECTYRGEIQAKNKGELKMYFVVGART